METESAAAAFAALGQPTRLALIQNLQGAGPEGLAAGDRVQFGILVPLSQQITMLQQTSSKRFRHANRVALEKVDADFATCTQTMLAANMTLYWSTFKQMLDLHTRGTRTDAPGVTSLNLATCRCCYGRVPPTLPLHTP